MSFEQSAEIFEVVTAVDVVRVAAPASSRVADSERPAIKELEPKG